MAEQSVQRAWEIRAPQAGTISFVLATPGQSVASGQPLAQLVPENAEVEAELLAPSAAAGFIRIGQRVHLRYRAYAYQKFGQQGGAVREISATAFAPDARAEASYRIRVQLDQQYISAYGERRALQPGAAVDASVQLERRRLYEWLLDPLYSLRGHF
jgi:membrane fusion protein